MSKSILFIIIGLSSLVWSELVDDKCANTTNYRSNDLIPIVKKGIYSTPYTCIINDSVSYLFLYDYMPVKLYTKSYLYYILKFLLLFLFLFQDSIVKPPRVKVTLIEPENNNIVDPLIVVVRHRSGVISWQLPYIEKQQAVRQVCMIMPKKIENKSQN